MGGDRKLCVVCSKVYRLELTECPDDGTHLVIEAGGTADRASRLGHVIGNHRLIRVLGDGGVGTVYEAEHVRLGRKVAIKLLHPDVVNDEVVTRFFNEARAVNAIRSPNIIDVEDFVTTPTGESYMVMELLEGRDLRSAITKDKPLDPATVTSIGIQVANALAAVHGVGIIHRDLKPDNIFLVERDGKLVAKLLDFGVAKFTNETTGLTRADMTMGTPHYMAPEQIITGKQVGVGSDLYSLGMVLYECLVGRPAFPSEILPDVLRAHCFEVPVAPSKLRTDAIPQVLESVVLKCLAKEPADRFASAAALGLALGGTTPVAVPRGQRAPTAITRPRRSIQMLPAFAMAAAALVLHLWPHTERTATAASPAPIAIPAVRAIAPPTPPTPTPSAPSEIRVALVSNPLGAMLFLGAARKPLGMAPVTIAIPSSSDPIALIARFPDGREVVETIVPDRPHPEVMFVAPPVVPPTTAPIRVVKPKLPRTSPVGEGSGSGDRDGTMDPFKR